MNDFLVEIGTEELPPKALYKLANVFAQKIEEALIKSEVSFREVGFFATPRRLAVYVSELAENQSDRIVERLGPALALAYDENKQPTAAAIGFAKSVQVPLEDLLTKETPKGECLYFKQQLPGETIFKLAPDFVKKALGTLPIPKPMNWGDHTTSFIRPVHWVLMMYGEKIIPCELFELNASNQTFGHRFHHKNSFEIKKPQEYVQTLENQGFVIPNFEVRREKIRSQIETLAQHKGKVVINEALLEEVTGLVEWPCALFCTFDERFLTVPQEALISAMQYHQKCFHLVDAQEQLLPYFITVANIESKHQAEVVRGNERVMRARLADAEFFYHTDIKNGLSHYLQQLKTVIFQNKLGTLFDKATRIGNLAEFIGKQMNVDSKACQRAGLLSKADLTTEMVGEFPELQGIMGYYYALDKKEDETIAVAIKEHYQPRFAGDALPKSGISTAVALADKLDTLIGIFGIHQAPTGEKDPFGLRRSALGILRLLIENQLALDLKVLLNEAKNQYDNLENANVVAETLAFIMERLKSWYLEQDIEQDVYASVFARYPTSPHDFDKRINGVQNFVKLPEAQALTLANKRVNNILKEIIVPTNSQLNYALLELDAEKELAEIIDQVTKKVSIFCENYQYVEALTLLAKLRKSIDQFFDNVMVMSDNEKIRDNRIILLNNLRQLFLQIADISLLQVK